jgi:DNA-binding CsgD family transcriptional regulator
MDAGAISALTECNGDANPGITPDVSNAVIHRIEFLSGARYHLVLFNLPPDQAQRSPHLFKLLSSHVKMALSWRVSHRETTKRVPLTPRELEILDRMKQGNSNREISTLLGINPITLKTHVAKIYRKLDVQTRAEAVMHGHNAIVNMEPAAN